jgi:hypothetical protein
LYTPFVTRRILPILLLHPASLASFLIDSPTVVLSVGAVYSVLSVQLVVNGTRCWENSTSSVPIAFMNVQVEPFK